MIEMSLKLTVRDFFFISKIWFGIGAMARLFTSMLLVSMEKCHMCYQLCSRQQIENRMHLFKTFEPSIFGALNQITFIIHVHSILNGFILWKKPKHTMHSSFICFLVSHFTSIETATNEQSFPIDIYKYQLNDISIMQKQNN